MINFNYLAPSDASDAANGVEDEPKPVVFVDESFERLFVKYVDEEFWSSVFSLNVFWPNIDGDKLWKPKPLGLNWPNKRIGVDVFTSRSDLVSFSVWSFDDEVVSAMYGEEEEEKKRGIFWLKSTTNKPLSDMLK